MLRAFRRQEAEVANHKSAKKRARQDLVRRDRNRQVQSRVRTVVKTVRTAVAEGDAEAAQKSLRSAERELRKAASKGVVPQRRASRSVSRLARAVHKIS